MFIIPIIALVLLLIILIFYFIIAEGELYFGGATATNHLTYDIVVKELESVTAAAKCEKPIIESALHDDINAVLTALFVAPDTYIYNKVFRVDYRLITDAAAKKLVGKKCEKNAKHNLHEIQSGIRTIMDNRRISLDLTDRIADCLPNQKGVGPITALRFICKLFNIPVTNKIKSMTAPTHIAVMKIPSKIPRQNHMHKLSSIIYSIEKETESLFVCQGRWYRLRADDIMAIEDADIENYLLTATSKEIIIVYRREGLLDNPLANIMALDGEISDPDLLAKAIMYYVENIRAKNVLFIADHNTKLLMLIIYYAWPTSPIVYTRLPYFSGCNMPIARNPHDLQMLVRRAPLDAIVSVGWETIPFAGDAHGVYQLVSAERDAFTYIRNNHGNIFWYDFSRKYTSKSNAWTRISLGTNRNFYVDKATLGGVILQDIDAYLQSYELSEQQYYARRIPVPLPLLIPQPAPSTSQLLMQLAPSVPTGPPLPQEPPREVQVVFPEGMPDPESKILGGD